MAHLNIQKASNPEFPVSTPCNSCFSIVFINNLINNKSKNMKKSYYLFCIVRAPLSYL